MAPAAVDIPFVLFPMADVLDVESCWHQLYHEMFDNYVESAELDELFATFISTNDSSCDFADLINDTMHALDSSTDSIQDGIVLFIFYEFKSRVSKDIIVNVLKKCDFDVDRAIANISAMPVTGVVIEKKLLKKLSLTEFLASSESAEAENYGISSKVNANETFRSIVSQQSDNKVRSNKATASNNNDNNSNNRKDKASVFVSRETSAPIHQVNTTCLTSHSHDSEWKVVQSRRPKELDNFTEISRLRNQLNAEYADMVSNYRHAASMYRNNQGNSCRAYAEIATAHRAKLHNTTLWYSKFVFEQHNPTYKIEVDTENGSLLFASPLNDLPRTVSFDLHYLFVKPMRMIASSILFFYLDTKSVDTIKFIVGKGLHSASGVCKVKKNLSSMLDSYGFDHKYDDGIVVVKL